ncbi:MAG: GTP-binding protein, partial [Halomonas sp.]
LTLCDQSTAEQLSAARAFVAERWPPRKWVHEVDHGRLPLSRLLESGSAQPDAMETPATHQTLATPPSLEGGFFDFPPAPGRPQCETGASLGYASIGLRWHPSDCFDLDRLAAYLGELSRDVRVKGVFHTHDGWRLLNRADGALSVTPSTWRQDSRLEVIAPEASTQRLPDATALKAALVDTMEA